MKSAWHTGSAAAVIAVALPPARAQGQRSSTTKPLTPPVPNARANTKLKAAGEELVRGMGTREERRPKKADPEAVEASKDIDLLYA